MNFLETIGLITVIGVGGYVLTEHLKIKDKEAKRIEDVKWRAMYISYRFALRHLYHQHHEPKVREKLMHLAES